MSLNRTELTALRQEAENKFRKAEDDYRRDLEAIDRLVERFCSPSPETGSLPHIPKQLAHRASTGRPSELEARIRDVMTRGNAASPWSAPVIYDIIKKEYEFTQQRDGAVNNILWILKTWAVLGVVSEEKGRGRRASQFTWNEAIYPKGPTNGGVHYAPIGVPLPTGDENQTPAEAGVV